jgi:hypothetical protein
MLVQASYDYVLPPPEVKGNQHTYFPCLSVQAAAMSIFNVKFLSKINFVEGNNEYK